MSLLDRDYMRGPTKHRDMVWTPAWGSAVIWLALLHAAITLVSKEALPTSTQGLALVPALVWQGEVWRMLSGVFCSPGYLALAAAAVLIWVLGRHVEYERGSLALVKLYAGGSSAAVAVALLVAVLAGNEDAITVSLPACWCLLAPGLEAGGRGRVLGLPPRTIVIIVAALGLLGFLAAWSPGWRMGAPAEYAATLAALTWGVVWRRWLAGGARRARQQVGPGAWAANQQEDHEFQARVNAALEKVREVGMAGLSEAERRLLTEATRREAEREKRLGRVDKL